MNLEIVEFYLDKRDDAKQFLQGTLHVYLADFGIDLRGVFVMKKKNFWRFAIPHKKTIDPNTNKSVLYPIISFIDFKICDALMAEIRERGKEYIIANFLNTLVIR